MRYELFKPSAQSISHFGKRFLVGNVNLLQQSLLMIIAVVVQLACDDALLSLTPLGVAKCTGANAPAQSTRSYHFPQCLSAKSM